MTIRMPVLQRMLQAETAALDHFTSLSGREQQAYVRANPTSPWAEHAASSWFEGLGDSSKQAYLKAHPKSKFGGGGKALPTTARGLMKHHEDMAKFHSSKRGEDHRDASRRHKEAKNRIDMSLNGTMGGTAGAHRVAMSYSRTANMASRNTIKASAPAIKAKSVPLPTPKPKLRNKVMDSDRTVHVGPATTAARLAKEHMKLADFHGSLGNKEAQELHTKAHEHFTSSHKALKKHDPENGLHDLHQGKHYAKMAKEHTDARRGETPGPTLPKPKTSERDAWGRTPAELKRRRAATKTGGKSARHVL